MKLEATCGCLDAGRAGGAGGEKHRRCDLRSTRAALSRLRRRSFITAAAHRRLAVGSVVGSKLETASPRADRGSGAILIEAPDPLRNGFLARWIKGWAVECIIIIVPT